MRLTERLASVKYRATSFLSSHWGKVSVAALATHLIWISVDDTNRVSLFLEGYINGQGLEEMASAQEKKKPFLRALIEEEIHRVATNSELKHDIFGWTPVSDEKNTARMSSSNILNTQYWLIPFIGITVAIDADSERALAQLSTDEVKQVIGAVSKRVRERVSTALKDEVGQACFNRTEENALKYRLSINVDATPSCD